MLLSMHQRNKELFNYFMIGFDITIINLKDKIVLKKNARKEKFIKIMSHFFFLRTLKVWSCQSGSFIKQKHV